VSAFGIFLKNGYFGVLSVDILNFVTSVTPTRIQFGWGSLKYHFLFRGHLGVFCGVSSTQKSSKIFRNCILWVLNVTV
jgi:hypothetical protein